MTSGVKSASDETMPNASGPVGIQDVEGVDHHRHVARVLALRIVELLHRPDRVLVKHFLPAAQPLLLPVAVGAPDARLAEGRQLVEDEVDLGRRELSASMRSAIRGGRSIAVRLLPPFMARGARRASRRAKRLQLGIAERQRLGQRPRVLAQRHRRRVRRQAVERRPGEAREALEAIERAGGVERLGIAARAR
jgi:hypothetical protein